MKVPLGVRVRLKNGEAIHLEVDSSSLKVYGECEWNLRKNGWSKRRTWCKIHLGLDEKTGEIAAQVLTDNKTDDAAVLVDLVADTFDQGVDINKVGTDGAYDHYDCWDMLVDLEIEPIIPPRENAVLQLDEDGTPTEHPRNLALEIIDQGGQEANRKGWKVQSGYHRRSKSDPEYSGLPMEDNTGRKNVCSRIYNPENRSRHQSVRVEQIYSNRRSEVCQSRLTFKRERDGPTEKWIHATKPWKKVNLQMRNADI